MSLDLVIRVCSAKKETLRKHQLRSFALSGNVWRLVRDHREKNYMGRVTCHAWRFSGALAHKIAVVPVASSLEHTERFLTVTP
jgi:hypothetical protein